MKHKFLLIFSTIVLIGLVSGIIIFSESQDQKPEYRVSVTNSSLVDQNTFEFDLLIQAYEDSFELTSYQCALYVWERLKETDSLSCSYVEGSSEISLLPNAAFSFDGSGDLPLIAFGSFPGNEMITTSSKKLGRIRIKSTKPFKSEPILEWNFKGEIRTILTGKSFSEITVNTQHIVTGD
ncbi:MAG: hypothetical protein IPM56_11630 [Ignavibacteriales bacterium]|nr:MAG: hypothetical protein IPM56_11630 [Ignavibacteriales bacterium]